MTDQLNLEDRVILELLESSEEGFRQIEEELLAAGDLGDDSEVRRTLREYAELAGLLPLSLEPVTPDPAVKERVMAAVREQAEPGRRGDSGAREGRPTQTAGGIATDRRFLERSRREHPRAVRGFGRYMPYLVAATLALVLGGVVNWFHEELVSQRMTVAQLREELQSTTAQLGEISNQRRDVMASLRGMALLAPSSIEVCPLRPAGSEPVQPEARGSLVMASAEGRWSVRLHNLRPAAAGQVYTLWLLDDDDKPFKKVNLGTGDPKIELDSTMMPGMMMTAATVTLEMSPEVERPTGPQVLYGHAREMDRL